MFAGRHGPNIINFIARRKPFMMRSSGQILARLYLLLTVAMAHIYVLARMQRSAIREHQPGHGNRPPGNYPAPRGDAPDSISFHPGLYASCPHRVLGWRTAAPSSRLAAYPSGHKYKAAPEFAAGFFQATRRLLAARLGVPLRREAGITQLPSDQVIEMLIFAGSG